MYKFVYNIASPFAVTLPDTVIIAFRASYCETYEKYDISGLNSWLAYMIKSAT